MRRIATASACPSIGAVRLIGDGKKEGVAFVDDL
jgi:hypothetical protein